MPEPPHDQRFAHELDKYDKSFGDTRSRSSQPMELRERRGRNCCVLSFSASWNTILGRWWVWPRRTSNVLPLHSWAFTKQCGAKVNKRPKTTRSHGRGCAMLFSFPVPKPSSIWQGFDTSVKFFGMVALLSGPWSAHSRDGSAIVPKPLSGCISRSQVAPSWDTPRMTGSHGAIWWLEDPRGLGPLEARDDPVLQYSHCWGRLQRLCWGHGPCQLWLPGFCGADDGGLRGAHLPTMSADFRFQDWMGFACL